MLEKQSKDSEEKLRTSGLNLLGDVAWGTHFCVFYDTKEDLLDILIPYFKAGLENNEYCMWVTSKPLDKKAAEEAMRKAVPDFDQYLKKPQIEILPYTEFYIKDHVFDLQRVLNNWMDKLDNALTLGYDGLRVTGNTAWLEKKDWKGFTDYEEEINTIITDYRMIAICTYQLEKCGSFEIIDVIRNHQFAMIRREGNWENFKSMEQIRVEHELKKSEEKYRSLVENAQEGIWVIDENATTTFANRRMAEMLGYSIEEMLGRHIFSFIDEAAKKNASHYIERRKQGIREQHDFEFLRKDGKIICTSIETAPILNEKGNFIGGIACVADITERKHYEIKLKESEEKYRLLYDSSPIGIEITEINGTVLAMNKRMEETTGFKLDDLNEFGLENTYVNPADRQKLLGLLNKFGAVQNYEVILRKKDGTQYFGLLNIHVIELAGKKVLFTTTQDISDIKKVEQRVKESEENYRNALNLANFYKDLFTHDMNNILQSIISSAEFYSLDRNDPERSKTVGDIAEVIKTHANRGATLIRNIRKLSKLDEAEGKLIATKIFDAFNKSVKDTISSFQARNVKIDVNGLSKDLKILGNELLVDVFDNILNNAVKYTDKEKKVKIDIKISKVLEDGTHYLKFEFMDYGMGVPNEKKDYLFERASKADISKSGMGLGLSLVKKIVDKYGGKIWVEDRVKGDYKQGSNFVVMLKEGL